jgi:hypothetical protein
MAFTAQELSNISAAALDFYIKGKPLAQTLQDRPLLKAIMSGKKSFPGGQGLIRRNVKGEYTTALSGYDGDDVISFKNPANQRQINFPWRELHGGISMTMTELKKDGISVVDSMTGKSTTEHSEAEMTRISSLLEDKMDDMTEGVARSLNSIGWLDGTQDSKVFPGVTAFLADSPTSGVVAGIDRGTTTWWRNRAITAASGGAIAASTANQTLTTTLRYEVRQLKRYGGRPSLLLAGSGFLQKLEQEVFAKGNYTQTGFQNKGATDIGLADIEMRGVGSFVYDPSLDDLGRTNYCYFIDPKHLYLMVMDGEDMKKHNPARPYDQFVIYQGVTWTGALIVDQLNCHGVYQAQ